MAGEKPLSPGVVEHGDGWEVAVGGPPIVGVQGSAVTLTYSVSSGVVVRIDGGFHYRSAAGERFRLRTDGDPVELGPLLELARADAAGLAQRTGELEAVFADGASVEVGSEGWWRVDSQDGLRLGTAARGPGLALRQPESGSDRPPPGAHPEDGASVEYPDRWVVPVQGCPTVLVDFALSFEFGVGSVRIENEFTYRSVAGDEYWLHPEGDPVRLAPVLASVRTDGVRLVAWRTGDLDIAFADGSAIRAGHSEDPYEAWSLNGPGGLLVVSMPAASGLSVWGPSR